LNRRPHRRQRAVHADRLWSTWCTGNMRCTDLCDSSRASRASALLYYSRTATITHLICLPGPLTYSLLASPATLIAGTPCPPSNKLNRFHCRVRHTYLGPWNCMLPPKRMFT
jgi:hypothetical protein